jgi:hypothetical protein
MGDSNGSGATAPSEVPERARFSSSSVDPVTIASRWGASVVAQDFGRSLTDPRGASVVDANGRRVYVGDTAQVALESEHVEGGRRFEGRVVGFRKDDEGNRVPVLLGRDILRDDQTRGPEYVVVATGWHATPGLKRDSRNEPPPPAPPALSPPAGVPERWVTGRPYI